MIKTTLEFHWTESGWLNRYTLVQADDQWPTGSADIRRVPPVGVPDVRHLKPAVWSATERTVVACT